MISVEGIVTKQTLEFLKVNDENTEGLDHICEMTKKRKKGDMMFVRANDYWFGLHYFSSNL